MPASAGMTRGGVYVGVSSQFMRRVRIVVVRREIAVMVMMNCLFINDGLLSICSTGSICCVKGTGMGGVEDVIDDVWGAGMMRRRFMSSLF